MKATVIVLLMIYMPSFAFCQTEYNKWFTNESLRVDYILAGNQAKTEVFFESLKKEPFWGGSKTQLIDDMGYGEYFCKVFPAESKGLIYSRGFSTLFQEWQTTAEAAIIDKGFFQSTVIPFPKEPIRFEIYKRNKKAEFDLVLSMKIDPKNYFIQPFPSYSYKVENIKISGDPAKNVDIVFIPEGYTSGQMGKFKSDILRLTDSLFTVAPYSSYRDKFNFYAVLAPSEEEGTDVPGANIWKNTLVNSSFYTFDVDRYLTTLDYWKVKDIAALAPYDQIYVLVNTTKYGGGGVYNHYNLTSASNIFSPQVFIHEFGHGFAGLGDEYYTSDVAYSDFYSNQIEPWEPNLTTLVNFSSKWEKLLKPGTPVPTPETPEYSKTTGVYEGGGYVAKGVYRPAQDCRMKSNQSRDFCQVCQLSIEKMILFLTK